MKLKFIKILDNRSGETANGTWRDVQFLAETIEDRPKKLALNSKGEACNKLTSMKEGDIFTVKYDIQSNQSKDGRWFTKVVVWSVATQDVDPPTSAYTGGGVTQARPSEPSRNASSDEDNGDLPF